MSEEIKQVVHMSTGRPEAGRHYAALYDAAQSELAALREELAGMHKLLDGAELSSQTVHEVLGRVRVDRDNLEQRLTAAEQRNSAIPTISDEQYEGLNDFFLSLCCDDLHRLEKPMIASLCEVGALESCGFGKHRLTKFGEYLLATAKPTESGASE